MEPALTWHLEKLPYFLAVIDHGSIGAASRVLGIAQPALSKSIRLLEEACGGRLFERAPSGAVPTHLGRRLEQTARGLMNSVREFVDTPSKERSLGFVTHEVLGPRVFPALSTIPTLRIRTHPSVRQLIDWLVRFEADCGVVASGKCPPGIHGELLMRDRYHPYASRAYLRRQGLKDLGSLSATRRRELPLVLAPGVLAGAGETLGTLLSAADPTLRARHEVESLESTLELVRSGFGYGYLPGWLAEGETSLHRLDEKGIGEHAFYFLCRERSWSDDPAVREIYKALKTRIGRKG